ncbi:MAG: type III-B CRISPR module RAMP protein Cmr1 [Caldilinea sp.]
MTQLRSIDLTLRVVTPMACGNADFLAEVRPPSFRGAGRFWLRALLGGIWGEDYQAVRTVENLIFGDTTRRSSLAVRTLDNPATWQLPIDPTEAPGLTYLYYTLYTTHFIAPTVMRSCQVSSFAFVCRRCRSLCLTPSCAKSRSMVNLSGEWRLLLSG